MRLDIELSSADTPVAWAPSIKMTNQNSLASEFTLNKIHHVELVFTPKWSAQQPEDNNVKADDEVTNMWYRYLSWGRPDNNEPNIKSMENSDEQQWWERNTSDATTYRTTTCEQVKQMILITLYHFII